MKGAPDGYCDASEAVSYSESRKNDSDFFIDDGLSGTFEGSETIVDEMPPFEDDIKTGEEIGKIPFPFRLVDISVSIYRTSDRCFKLTLRGRSF